MDFSAWELDKLQEAWEYFREHEEPVDFGDVERARWDALSDRINRVRHIAVLQHYAAFRASTGEVPA